MPVYEYRCPNCSTEFDALRSMSAADAPIACPKCKSTGARRKLSRFAATSKGDGGESHSVGGSDGCSSCRATTCSGCSHH